MFVTPEPLYQLLLDVELAIITVMHMTIATSSAITMDTVLPIAEPVMNSF